VLRARVFTRLFAAYHAAQKCITSLDGRILSREMRFAGIIPILAFSLTSCCCSSLYYASMKKVGKEKRDILASRILDAKKDQEKAKEQIRTTMEAFQELTGFQGGDLEKVYRKLNAEYEDAADRAKKVSDRINSIERVSNDLFKEWSGEISSMSDRQLKRSSLQLLNDTEKRQAVLLRKMREVEDRMRPVINTFHDKVLFLKHNLNARAIASLKQTGVQLDRQVASLLKDIEASTQEADAFITTLQTD